MEGKVAEAFALLRSIGYEVQAPEEQVDVTAAYESESEGGDASEPALTPDASEFGEDEVSDIGRGSTPLLTPAESEVDDDEEPGDGDRTPSASPVPSEAGTEILSSDFSNLSLPASAYDSSGVDRSEEREQYELVHGSIDADRLWPKDGEKMSESSVAEKEKKDEEEVVVVEKKEGKEGKAGEGVSGGAVSMSKAVTEIAVRLLPLVVAMGAGGSEGEEQTVGSGASVRSLLDQYLTNVSSIVGWLHELGSPLMQERGTDEVGGLQGMIERARAVALYAGFAYLTS